MNLFLDAGSARHVTFCPHKNFQQGGVAIMKANSQTAYGYVQQTVLSKINLIR